MSVPTKYINEIQSFADKHSKYVKLAFLAAVVALSKEIDDEALTAAIDSNSIDAIYRALHIDEFGNLLYGIGMDKDSLIYTDETRIIFSLAAAIAFSHLSSSQQKPWNYNPIEERAVALFTSDSSRIIRELTEGTKGGATLASLRVLADKGDIEAEVLRIKQSIGLTGPQAQAVLNFRQQLESRKLLGFSSPEDRKLSSADATLVRLQMKNGTMTQGNIDAIVGRYYENILNARAESIAMASTMNAINSGINNMFEQGLYQGVFDAHDRKFWLTAGDNKVRATHRAIPNMNPNGVQLNSMFVTPTGPVPYPMWGMGDYINCRCMIYLGRI